MVYKAVLLNALAAGALGRMLVGLDTETSNQQWSSDWKGKWPTDGEPVAYWDPESGVDSHGDRGHYRYVLGASWVDESANNELQGQYWPVVTDVMLVGSNRRETNCPIGYDRVGYWDTDGSGATDTYDRKSYWDLALCQKVERCSPDKEYVSKFIAFTSDDYYTPKTLDGASRIGYWDTQRGGAWSAYTRNRREHNIALYQKKEKCPRKIDVPEPTPTPATCEMVEIEDLEQIGATQGSFTGLSVRASHEADNCDGSGTLTTTVSLSAESSATTSSSYTLSKSLAESFTVGLSAEVGAKVKLGFQPPNASGGVNGGIEIHGKLATSTTTGITNSISNSETSLYSETKKLAVQKSAQITLKPGKRMKVYTDLNGFTYEARFKATAHCVDEEGNRIESTEIKGVYKGRGFTAESTTRTQKLPCPMEAGDLHSGLARRLLGLQGEH